MKTKMKKALKDAFAAPKPQNKQAFMRNIKQPEMSYSRFVLVQASYIRKWVWGLSFVIFTVALVGGSFMKINVMWLLSAMVPYLAVSFIGESIRSEIHGMAELEMASRFSLKSVVLARMGILGVSNLGLLCLLAALGHMDEIHTIFQTGVYLSVLYLLTAAGGLYIVRKIHGKESAYLSMGFAVIVSLLPMINRYMEAFFYQQRLFGWWIFAFIVLLFIAISEFQKMIERTEELTWNLS